MFGWYSCHQLVYMNHTRVYRRYGLKTLPSQHDWYPSWSKRVPELYLESHKVQYGWKDWTVVRPPNIFGEYDNFGEWKINMPNNIKKVYESNGEIVGWGDGTQDFILEMLNQLLNVWKKNYTSHPTWVVVKKYQSKEWLIQL